MNKYLNLYLKFLIQAADVKRPLQALLDASNGATGLILKKLKLPNLKFRIINAQPDGRFPAHGPNPGKPKALNQIKNEILKGKFDLGAVFDGDGDRAIFLDERGNKIDSYIIAHLLQLFKESPFVADVFNFKSLEQSGLIFKKILPSAVGTLNVKKVMMMNKASFGSEYSGHYLFKEFFYADSGILAAIQVMNSLSRLPYSLFELRRLLPEFYFKQFNLKTPNPGKIMAKVKSRYRGRARQINKLDGLIFDFTDWFFIVRPSNTEPVLRFFVGSKNKKVFQKEIKNLRLNLTKKF